MINKEIDDIRTTYKNEYDELFNQIRASKKYSDEHIALLKKEAILQSRTKSFLQKHSYYFSQKRISIFKNMEKAGMFGEQPRSFEIIERERINAKSI